MATASFESTKKTTNFARISRLLIDVCSKLLRDVLTKRIPKCAFNYTIQAQRRQLHLNADQNNLLFPPSGQFSGTYDDFDISLLYILLRNIGNILPHTNGWGNIPDVADRSLSANIERIRITRNKFYGHVKSASINDADFNTVWNELAQIINEIENYALTGCQYKDSIESLKTEALDSDKINLYKNSMLEMHQKEADTKDILLKQSYNLLDIKSEVQSLRRDVGPIKSDIINELKRGLRQKRSGITGGNLPLKNKVKSLEGRMESIELSKDMKQRKDAIDKSQRIIKQKLHQSDWVKINAYNMVVEMLKSHGWVIITGVPGNGKTTLASHVVYDIVNGQHFGIENKQPIVIKKPSDWEEIVNPSSNLIIFIDNIFGTFSMENVKEWKSVIDDIFDSATEEQNTNNNLVLLAQRTEIYNESRRVFDNHPIFQSVVDLTDETNFSTNDKLLIFKQYTKNMAYRFTAEEQNSIMHTPAFIGFPQCCSFYRQNDDLQQNGAKFFSNPVEFLQSNLKTMRNVENEKFCALTLIMMNGGKMHKSEFETQLSTIVNKISDFSEMDKSKNEINSKNLITAASLLVGTYLSLNDNIFTFLHESIHHTVAMVLWDVNQKDVVLKCSCHFLPCIGIQSSRKDTAIVVAPKYIYPTIVYRVVEELKSCSSTSYKCIADMRIWEDSEFVKSIHEVNTQCDWNKCDEKMCSLLYYATGSKNIPLIDFLLSKYPSQSQMNAALNVACELPDLYLFDRFNSGPAKILSETAFSALKGRNQVIFKKVIETDIDVSKCFQSKQDPDCSKINFLQELCLSGNYNFFQVWIQVHGDEVFTKYMSEYSLVYFAAQKGCMKIIQHLMKINEGLDITEKDQTGQTVLHYACLKGNLSLVQYLCEDHPTLLQITGAYNRTPLHYTAWGTGSVEVASYLIGKNLNFNKKDEDGATVLHRACYKGHLSLVQYLCDHQPTLLQVKGKYNRTPLHYTANGTGSEVIASYLINKDLNVNTRDANGETVLHSACYNGHFSLVQYLCDHYPALLHKTGRYSWTPLHYTAEGTGSVDIAKYLIEKGLNVNIRDEDGETLLHRACNNGHLSLVQYLCEDYPKLLKITSDHKKTPLHCAADGTGFVDVTKTLIGKGLNVDTKDEYSDTILNIACYHGHFSLVQYLCDHCPKLLDIRGEVR